MWDDSTRRTLVLFLGGILALPLAFPNGRGYLEMDIDLSLDGKNIVGVDAGVVNPITGKALVTAYEEHASNITNLYIYHTPIGYTNYTLNFPNGTAVHMNNAPLSDGSTLFFRNVPVVAHVDWTLSGDGEPILLFDIPSTTLFSGWVFNGGWCYPYQYEMVRTKHYWTPTSIVHSPFKGEGISGSSESRSTFEQVGSIGWTSRTEYSTESSTTNGDTAGFFEKDLWEYGKLSFYCYGPYPHTHVYPIVWIKERYNIGLSGVNLAGESNQTDEDDAQSFYSNPYPSIQFQNRYLSPTGMRDHQGTGTHEEKVSNRKSSIFTATVDITVGYTGAATTFNAYHYYEEESQEHFMKYKFFSGQSNAVCVAFDHFGSPGTRIAFKTLDSEECTQMKEDLNIL